MKGRWDSTSHWLIYPTSKTTNQFNSHKQAQFSGDDVPYTLVLYQSWPAFMVQAFSPSGGEQGSSQKGLQKGSCTLQVKNFL